MASSSRQSVDVAVAGGGISGLGAALRLAAAGRSVAVLEAGPALGGLAGSFSVAGRPAERFYHYACAADSALLALCRELGLEKRLRWRRCRLDAWDGAALRPASTPAGLMSLPLPLAARLRLAAGLAFSASPLGAPAGDPEAGPWLERRLGRAGYAALFEPLLLKKFGPDGARVSAAWIQRRLRRAAAGGSRFACFEGGYGALFEALGRRLRERGVALKLSCRVRSLRREAGGWRVDTGRGPLRARQVLAALPAPALLPLLPRDAAPSPWLAAARALRYQSLLQPVLHLKKPLMPSFWTNLNPAGTPFCGLLQYDRLDGSPRALLYLPLYCGPDSRWARASDAALYKEAYALLGRLQPSFSPGEVLGRWIMRERHAQPWVGAGFASARPGMAAPWPGLFFLEACHLFPEDRSLNACLEAAEACTRLMLEAA